MICYIPELNFSSVKQVSIPRPSTMLQRLGKRPIDGSMYSGDKTPVIGGNKVDDIERLVSDINNS